MIRIVYRPATALLTILAVAASLRGDAAKAPLHDELARLVGNWDCDVTFVLGGKENHGKAKCEAKWILNENCVEQQYDSNFAGRPLRILQMLSYDPGRKKLVEIHMTNLHGGALCNRGDTVGGGKEWKLTGPYFDPQVGKEVEMRTVYTFDDADHFTLDWFTPGADGKEVRSVHIVHTRQK